jgi:hypothetical protein
VSSSATTLPSPQADRLTVRPPMEGEHREADVLDVNPNPHDGGRAIAQQWPGGRRAIQGRGRGVRPELVNGRLVCPEFPASVIFPCRYGRRGRSSCRGRGVALCGGAKQGHDVIVRWPRRHGPRRCMFRPTARTPSQRTPRLRRGLRSLRRAGFGPGYGQTTSSANTSARVFMSPWVKATYARLNTSMCDGLSRSLLPPRRMVRSSPRRPMTLTLYRRPWTGGRTGARMKCPV